MNYIMNKKKSIKKCSQIVSLSLIGTVLMACTQDKVNVEQNDKKGALVQQKVPEFWPEIPQAVKVDPQLENKIKDLLNKMTLAQKVAQMIQPEIRDITVEDMRQYGFGSYLNGGGSFPGGNKHATPADWIKLAEDMYQASIDDSLDGSTIPTMWGTDAVHGHNNVIGATLFPHNIGLGAANNPELIEQIASITAKEVMVTGIDWVFAPTVAVVRDDRWGRTYEGYSEEPVIVKAYASAIVKGLQGVADRDFLSDQRVIGTVKHFIGDGGTVNGDDQGDNLASEKALFDIHAQGYVGGLTAGAQTVMASFNSWQGVKSHGNKYLLTDVLKTRMGFDGLVVGDWNGHGQIPGCSNENCSAAVNAGLDIYMVPTQAWKPLFHNTVAQVQSGEISMQRIDDAVSRILRVKLRAGLFEKPSPAKRLLSGKTDLIGSAEHRKIARQAVRESLVLLKNKGNILPLLPKQHFLIAGNAADNIGKQSGGWTITWQGTNNKNADFPGATSIYSGIQQVVKAGGGTLEFSETGEHKQKPDIAIVVFGEEPYAEGNGDLDNLEYQRGNKTDLALLKKFKAEGIPVVAVFISGRPLWINAELNATDAFVAAWLPGTEGAGVADVIFSKPDGEINHDFKGRLSYSWPAMPNQSDINGATGKDTALLPYGFGLKYAQANLLSDNLPEITSGASETLQAMVLFKNAVKPPFQMMIGNKQKQTPVISSMQQNEIVHIRTIDKHIQEDARKVTFNGKGLGKVSLTSAFPSDLRAYSEADSALTFKIKIDKTATSEVFIGMGCQGDCDSSIDLSAALHNLPLNTWQDISVDLACFKNNGADLGQIFTPFSVSTQGELDLNFTDIKIQPHTGAQAVVKCQ